MSPIPIDDSGGYASDTAFGMTRNRYDKEEVPVSTAAHLLRQARRAKHLSQRVLATRSGMHQPAVAAIESADRDTRVENLQRLLASAGQRLTTLPTTWAPTASDTADELYSCLRQDGDGDRVEEIAFRILIGFSDSLRASDPVLRVALSVTPPPPCGDARFDAALAGVVEHHLRPHGLPVPTWVDDPERRLPTPWRVSPWTDPADVPEAFAHRNVLLAASELASV